MVFTNQGKINYHITQRRLLVSNNIEYELNKNNLSGATNLLPLADYCHMHLKVVLLKLYTISVIILLTLYIYAAILFK